MDTKKTEASDKIKTIFEQNRNDENHHLGLGDIRLTIAQQKKVLKIIDESHKWTNSLESNGKETSDQEIYDNFDEFDERLEGILEDFKHLLVEKNKWYGSNALEPIKVFSNLSGEEGIKTRLDDKLKRVKNSEELRKNDVADLIGYLILLSINKNYNFEDLID